MRVEREREKKPKELMKLSTCSNKQVMPNCIILMIYFISMFHNVAILSKFIIKTNALLRQLGTDYVDAMVNMIDKLKK